MVSDSDTKSFILCTNEYDNSNHAETCGLWLTGSKSPDALIKKLEEAIRKKDKGSLDRAIRECLSAGLPGLEDAIQNARKISDMLGGGTGG